MVSMCIQCRHGDRVGSFLRDNGTRELQSPIFDDYLSLTTWMKDNGWVKDPERPLGVNKELHPTKA